MRINDASERFDEGSLTERIVSRLDGDDLILDGAEWWVEEDDLDGGVFTMTDDETGEAFKVTLLAEIRRVSA